MALDFGSSQSMVMDTNFPKRRKQPVTLLAQMGKTLPGPMDGFASLHKEAVAEGSLSTKVTAVRQAVDRAGWKIGDIERIEINEAFAAIVIAVTRELGLPKEIVNVEGGAIAHGHPIGATGAVLTTRLLHSMKRDNIKHGVVTLCIGGGQGIALALQVLH
jgi:acetyl-CoA C-acetyltransferase